MGDRRGPGLPVAAADGLISTAFVMAAHAVLLSATPDSLLALAADGQRTAPLLLARALRGVEGGEPSRGADAAALLRGAAFQPARKIGLLIPPGRRNAYDALPAQASEGPKFDLVATLVEQSRKHRLPTYNDLRAAYGLRRVASFAEVTPDRRLAQRLAALYGGM